MNKFNSTQIVRIIYTYFQWKDRLPGVDPEKTRFIHHIRINSIVYNNDDTYDIEVTEFFNPKIKITFRVSEDELSDIDRRYSCL